MDELFQQLGDDDVRIRENAAKCLSRFIMNQSMNSGSGYRMQDHSYSSSGGGGGITTAIGGDVNNLNSIPDPEADDTTSLCSSLCCSLSLFHSNFKLMAEFIDYSVFQELPAAIRNVLYGSLNVSRIPDDASRVNRSQLLAKILYHLTNRILSLEDKHLQVK